MKPIISKSQGKSHLRAQKRLERHHGRLTAVVAPVGPGVTSAASASASRSVASAEAAVRTVPVVVSSEIAAAVMVIPLIMW